MIRNTTQKLPLKKEGMNDAEYVKRSNALIEEFLALIDSLDSNSTALIDRLSTEIQHASTLNYETKTRAQGMFKTMRSEYEQLKESISEYIENLDTENQGIVDQLLNQEHDIITEVKAIVKEVRARKGEKGDPGKDYVLTVQDKEEIASKIDVPIVEKVIEKIVEKVEVKTTDEEKYNKLSKKITELRKELTDLFEKLKRDTEVSARNFIRGSGLTEEQVQALIDASSSATTWGFYKDHWSVIPTNIATITGGNVWQYTLDGVTRYRFVPSPYDPTQDAFYTTFSSPTLSGLIVSKG